MANKIRLDLIGTDVSSNWASLSHLPALLARPANGRFMHTPTRDPREDEEEPDVKQPPVPPDQEPDAVPQRVPPNPDESHPLIAS